MECCSKWSAEDDKARMPDLQTSSSHVESARQEGDAVILTLDGEIDLHGSPDLRTDLLALLQQTGAKKLILNLQKVPYVDSSAIAIMVEALQRLRKISGKLCLTGLQPRVKGIIEIARLNTLFSICKDEAEALKA
jgi:anti-sigma B factor antagonist